MAIKNVKKDKLHKKNVKNKVTLQDQKALALWAADCAEQVLFYFEKECPKDTNPRKAIEAARKWACGEITVGEARKAAFASHSSARSVKNTSAVAAARSAAHAAATAHVASHAPHAAEYAFKAVKSTNFKS